MASFRCKRTVHFFAVEVPQQHDRFVACIGHESTCDQQIWAEELQESGRMFCWIIALPESNDLHGCADVGIQIHNKSGQWCDVGLKAVARSAERREGATFCSKVGFAPLLVPHLELV